MGSLLVDSFKIILKFRSYRLRDYDSETSMDGATAQQEVENILAQLPDRISDVIKPFARESPDQAALVQGNVTWSYAELADIVAEAALILKYYDIRPGDRVMIVSKNSLALAALILATSEIDAWSVVVNPRLSAREVDLIREHSGARRLFIRSRCPTPRANMPSGTTPTSSCFARWGRSASGSSIERRHRSRSRRIARARSRR
jgi:AMP-binding enzyme